jgi:hypothetical protein
MMMNKDMIEIPDNNNAGRKLGQSPIQPALPALRRLAQPLHWWTHPLPLQRTFIIISKSKGREQVRQHGLGVARTPWKSGRLKNIVIISSGLCLRVSAEDLAQG